MPGIRRIAFLENRSNIEKNVLEISLKIGVNMKGPLKTDILNYILTKSMRGGYHYMEIYEEVSDRRKSVKKNIKCNHEAQTVDGSKNSRKSYSKALVS